jgi:hypothetical protein
MADHATAVRAWREVCAKRQAVRDALTLPARFAALCEYHGALSSFVNGHWAQIDALFDYLPLTAANDHAAVPMAAANDHTAVSTAPRKRRTPAEIDALVRRAREMLSQEPRPAKARIATELGVTAGYLAQLLAR